MKDLFDRQRKSLEEFFSQVDVSAAVKVLEKLGSCSGTLILTGIGKSGYIAQKIAAMMLSTGTPARFLCPLQALHGDLGMLKKDDILILFSKSGESNELLNLLPHAQAKEVFTVGIVSKADSHLAKQTDLSMVLPQVEELCPFDLAPTTSTVTQLLFGDALAIALMEKRRFSRGDFATNHPSGLLGRKITLKVADLMLKQDEIPICKMDTRLIETLHELSSKKCGCLLICDEKGALRGIFTDGDLRRAIESKGSDALKMRLEELMSPAPRTTNSKLLALDAIRQMEEDPKRLVSVLPVIEGKRVVGLLRMHDIVQAGLI